MTMYRIRLFAQIRERTGTDAVSVSVPMGATVADLRADLARQWPDLADLISKSAVAVNEDFADSTRLLQPGDDVAIIPPVSGGAN